MKFNKDVSVLDTSKMFQERNLKLQAKDFKLKVRRLLQANQAILEEYSSRPTGNTNNNETINHLTHTDLLIYNLSHKLKIV